jgi:hypothetical protein
MNADHFFSRSASDSQTRKVVEVVVALADLRRPEAGVADAVLLPELEGNGLKALEQRRQAAGNAGVDAQLVQHGVLSFGA